jgi:hypothetical protein
VKRLRLGAVLLAALLLLSGCDFGDKITEPFKDAPRSNVTNDSAADVIEAPDGFSNLATKCDHGNRLYIGYHGDLPYAAIAVVPADPTCKR